MLAPWAELGAPAIPPAPFGGKSWRSAPAGRSDSRCEGVPEPAVRPEVLAELVEQHEPEVPVTSGPDLPTTAVEAGTTAPLLVLLGRPVLLLLVPLRRLEARTGVAAESNGNNLPIFVLHL